MKKGRATRPAPQIMLISSRGFQLPVGVLLAR